MKLTQKHDTLKTGKNPKDLTFLKVSCELFPFLFQDELEQLINQTVCSQLGPLGSVVSLGQDALRLGFRYWG